MHVDSVVDYLRFKKKQKKLKIFLDIIWKDIDSILDILELKTQKKLILCSSKRGIII